MTPLNSGTTSWFGHSYNVENSTHAEQGAAENRCELLPLRLSVQIYQKRNFSKNRLK